MNEMISRSLTVLADGEPLSFSGRIRLAGEDDLSLFPALFTLEMWNLPEEMFLRLSRCREVSVLCGDACLVSGAVSDVFRHAAEEGTVTAVSVSRGLELWEACVSVYVPAGSLLSEAVSAVLDASGTGIPLLAFPAENPALLRSFSFFGRASDGITELLSCHSGHSEESYRAVLTPSGLKVIPPGGLPVSLHMTRQDLQDVPAFTGGSLRGPPSLMLLSAGLAGWRPGETLELDWNGRACTGIILARSVEADTGSGPWKSEMIVELIP